MKLKNYSVDKNSATMFVQQASKGQIPLPSFLITSPQQVCKIKR